MRLIEGSNVTISCRHLDRGSRETMTISSQECGEGDTSHGSPGDQVIIIGNNVLNFTEAAALHAAVGHLIGRG